MRYPYAIRLLTIFSPNDIHHEIIFDVTQDILHSMNQTYINPTTLRRAYNYRPIYVIHFRTL
jgi:hypothetical protein